MFYYYGRKKQIAKHYPQAELDTIVEPFAGSAAYALHGDHWRKRVILVEKDERVGQVWRWLIEEATQSKLEALPTLKVGEKSSEFLHIIHAATKMAFRYKTIKVTPVLQRNWEISKRVMATSIHKVKHWELIIGDYRSAPDIVATWFIDPPYQSDPGEGYQHSSRELNYRQLAEWAMQRKGQVICCEGTAGAYLPFEPLLTLSGVAGKLNQEQIYHRSARASV